jgi:hypothetical protein
VHRRAAALLAAACLVAACGADRADDAVPEPAPSTPPTLAVPTPVGGTDRADDTATEPGDAHGHSVAPPPTAAAPGAPPAPAAPGSEAGPVTPVAGDVGSLAATYLRPAGAASILVEVRSQAGAEPRPAAIQRVAAVLGQITGKPVTIATGVVDGGSRSWTADELRAVADQGAAQAAERAVLRLLYLHGGFAENDRAVGVAVRGDLAAVFADRVAQAAGTLGDRAAVEDAVTMHEVGHLLGLVDLVIDTGRADPDHPGHSPNRGSVMYHAVESTLLASVLAGGPPRDFDADDLSDLARIRDS